MLLNTRKTNDLKRFAQALLIIKHYQIISLNKIKIVDFKSSNISIDYLFFYADCISYEYKNNEIKAVIKI